MYPDESGLVALLFRGIAIRRKQSDLILCTWALPATLGQPKAGVVAMLASDINPSSALELSSTGVTRENVDGLLCGADNYAVAVAFFATDACRMLFAACRERGIPVLAAAPPGMGVSSPFFRPSGVSFEDCFRLEGFRSG